MEKRIDENLIKISGKVAVDRQLELGDEIEITIRAGVVKKEIFDLQDGSVNVAYIAKPKEVINLTVISN